MFFFFHPVTPCIWIFLEQYSRTLHAHVLGISFFIWEIEIDPRDSTESWISRRTSWNFLFLFNTRIKTFLSPRCILYVYYIFIYLAVSYYKMILLSVQYWERIRIIFSRIMLEKFISLFEKLKYRYAES